MTRTAVWKARPVFITSTFLDMQAERDHLRKVVFPALEEWLLTRRRHLEWIDLRVGVASATAKDEAEREVLVLKVCLDEVKRSRPFLIALIGDRYGWVPPKSRVEAAAAEAGFTSDITERSVTDLEIDFGVFQDTEQRRRSLFFLRKPLPYGEMPPETAAEYSDAHATDDGAAARVKRLDDLKARIKKELRDRCFEYTLGWDPKTQDVTETALEAWGQDVKKKIKQAIEDELANEPPAPADQTRDEIERDALIDFAEDRARDFVGRKDILADIEALLTSPPKDGTPWGYCITGEAGSGKSALFGALHQGLTGVQRDDTARISGEQSALHARLRAIDALVLAHAAGASPRAASVDAMLQRWINELASFLGVDAGLAENARPDEVDAAFSSLLGRAALKRRVVVLLDAIDQFEQTPRGRFVTWLPRLWPENARLIATAIPGDASAALAKAPGIVNKPIPPLNAGEARQIAVAISARYHRTLEPQVLDALIDNRVGATPPWRNPLWLVIAVEELNLLDADDFARAKQLPAGRDDERLRTLMCRMAAEFTPDVSGLYRESFVRAAELFGEALTFAFLDAIAVSRSGWREIDFRTLLPAIGGEDWDELRFATLRRFFRGQIRQRGNNGQWDFAHAQMRIAAIDWITAKRGPTVDALHTVVGDHLLALSTDDPLRVSETMVHLLGGAAWERRAKAYYGSNERTEAEIDGATRVLATVVVSGSPTDTAAGARRVARVLYAPALSDLLAATAERVLFRVGPEIEGLAILDAKSVLYGATIRVFEELTGFVEEARWETALSVAYNKMGDVLVAQGNLPEALQTLHKGLSIRERRTKAGTGSADWQHGLSVSYLDIGDVHFGQGNLPKALKAFRDSHAISERLATADPGNASWQHALSVSFDRLGTVLEMQGNLSEALQAFRDGHAIAKRLAKADIVDTVRQHNLAMSYFKIGGVLVAEGNLPEALLAFNDGRAIVERLAKADPSDARWQHALSHSCVNIGEALVAQGDLPQAAQAFRDSLAIRERLAKADPANAGWQHNLAAAYDKLGDVHLAGGKPSQALRAYHDALTIFAHLTDLDPSNAVRQRDLLITQIKCGDVLVAQADLPQALRSFRECCVAAERLAASDRSNTGWQSDLSTMLDRVGDVLVLQAKLPEALQVFRDSLAIRERLSKVDPGNASWQHALSASYDQLGATFFAQGTFPEAMRAFEESLTIRKRLAELDSGNASWHVDLAISTDNIGELLVEQGDVTHALHWFRQTLAIVERLAKSAPENVSRQYHLAGAHDRIGDLLLSQGKQAEALQAFGESHATIMRLAEADPGNDDWQSKLADSHRRRGEIFFGQGAMAKALDAFGQSHAILERLATADSSNVNALCNVGIIAAKASEVAETMGNAQAACKFATSAKLAFEAAVKISPQWAMALTCP